MPRPLSPHGHFLFVVLWHTPTSGHWCSTLTLVMAEQRDGRFHYEVPLSTTTGHYHRRLAVTSESSTAYRHAMSHQQVSKKTRSSFLTTQKNLHNRKTKSGPDSDPSGINWPPPTNKPTRTHKRKSSGGSNSLLTEYTINSTIHGVKYLGGPARPWPERIWWIIMFVISISVCTALIMNTYKKWTSDPVIVTFSQMATPVWRIPFPAVTICPTNIVRQSQFNFTDILTKIQDAKTAKLNLTAKE